MMPKFDDEPQVTNVGYQVAEGQPSPPEEDRKFNYKYSEGKLLREIEEYINSTYNQHYSSNKYQATEFILDAGLGDGFCIGNIMKYSQRYGKKDGYNRKDLLKIIHYAIIALHNHDMNERG